MFYYIIYTNYNYKPLAKIKKLVISWYKFNKLVSKKGFKFAKKEKKRGKWGLYIYILNQNNQF